MPGPWSVTVTVASCSLALTRITTSLLAGLNFTALWSRLRSAWPRRSPSPRTRGSRGSASTTSPTPCRSAKRASRSTVACVSAARSTSWRTRAALPLSILERSSSSFTIWTRWPVSTSIFAIRSAVRGGSLAASRASVSASRLTVVSGVRSSCARLSMNSVRIRWSRRSSVTSSRTSQASPAGMRRARTRSVGASAVRIVISPTADPVWSAVRTTSSSRWSVEASITLRPGRLPGRRASSRAAVSFAVTTMRSSETRTTPIPTRSTSTPTSRTQAAARASADVSSTAAGAVWAAARALLAAPPARPTPRRWSPTARTSAAPASATMARRATRVHGGATRRLSRGGAPRRRRAARWRARRSLAPSPRRRPRTVSAG